MNKMKLAYFGSSDFSADFLEKLIIDTSIKHLIEVKFVVTQPDRPVGRKQILTPTPIKTVAKKYNVKYFEIGNLLGQLEQLEIRNLDLCFLYAYGAIIPKNLLTLPKHGFWCLHPSLLPKYRGTSPMATALINGDKETGVTIIKMDDQIDHGPIIVQEKYQILPTDRRPDLEKKLTELGFQMFRSVILNLVQDLKTRSRNKFGMTLKEQNHQQATYTKKLKKEDGFISFENFKFQISNTPKKLLNLFRGIYPWPGIWTILPNGKRLKITELNMVRNRHACSLQIKRAQLEGKKEVDFETFKKAYKIF